MKKKFLVAIALAVGMIAHGAGSVSAQNVALNAPIVDGSGSWNNDPHNVAPFQSSFITDGTGPDTQNGPGAFWLGRNGVVNEYLVVDLGATTNVQSIGLLNTHNAQFNDRGTRTFQIRGSNMLGDITGGAPTAPVILSGTLSTFMANAAGDSGNLRPLDMFNSANGLTTGDYRYVRFETLTSSFAAGLSNPAGDNAPQSNHVGLNELQVFSTAQSANVAGGKPIVDGSGAWNNNPFNVGQFAGENITDLRLDDFRDDASVDRTSYWLGRDGTANEFLTVDLLDTFTIDRIDLQNSHNAGSNDRGTNAFTIEGSLDGTNFFPVFSDQLANVAGTNFDIPIESFSAANGDFDVFDAQFIRFNANTFFGASAALNEIFVFGQVQVPEPGSVALWSLIAVVGAGWYTAARRRRKPMAN